MDQTFDRQSDQRPASLPAGGFVLFTDGGSNTNRNETGLGVTVLRKRARGHPEVVAELYGPVDTDSESDYYVGAISQTNDTAEATAAYQANLWLHNEDSHVPALIICDSERALTMMDGLSAIVGDAFKEMHGSSVGGINVVLSHHVRAMYKHECDRRKGCSRIA